MFKTLALFNGSFSAHYNAPTYYAELQLGLISVVLTAAVAEVCRKVPPLTLDNNAILESAEEGEDLRKLHEGDLAVSLCLHGKLLSNRGGSLGGRLLKPAPMQ